MPPRDKIKTCHKLKINQQKSDGECFVLGSFDIQDEATIAISIEDTSGFVIVDGLKFTKQ